MFSRITLNFSGSDIKARDRFYLMQLAQLNADKPHYVKLRMGFAPGLTHGLRLSSRLDQVGNVSTSGTPHACLSFEQASVVPV